MICRRLMLAVSALELIPIHVLDRVGRLARAFGAHVELFHGVYEPESLGTQTPRGGPGGVIAARVEERRRRLERLADILRDQGVMVSAAVRWDFPTYESIIRQALRYKPDLLIVPAVRLDETLRTMAYREQRLIEAAPCPVLFLKARDVYSKGCIVAEIDPHPMHDTFGDLDEVAIGAAKTLAGALADAPVHLHHAAPLGEGGFASSRAAASEAEVYHLAELHEIPKADVRVEFADPGESLVGYVREARAQMLVMGATFGPRESGEPAERLIDRLDCDVLVVKTHYEHATVSMKPSPAVLPQSL